MSVESGSAQMAPRGVGATASSRADSPGLRPRRLVERGVPAVSHVHDTSRSQAC